MNGWAVRAGLWASCWLAACNVPPPPPSVSQLLEAVEQAVRAGEPERAAEAAERLRAMAPHDVGTLLWSAVVAELRWRDDEAIRYQQAALRALRGVADADLEAVVRGRLGDLLFQAGRFAEAAPELRRGAIGPDAARRSACAGLAPWLPARRRPIGPLATEQPLLDGDLPELLCGTGSRRRPFAIDTGSSWTTLSASLAAELGLHQRRPAGTAFDGLGRPLPVSAGVLEGFRVGEVQLGAVPVVVVEDQAMALRDLFGGPSRLPPGVLGLDLIATLRLTLSPERDSVVLALPAGGLDDDAEACVRADGRCLLPVVVEGVRLWFVLDTGASHSSLTPAGLQALPGGDARAVEAFRRVRAVGGSATAVREVRGLTLQTSAARFHEVSLPVVARGVGSLFPVHGVLGFDLLRACRTTFDSGFVRLEPMGRAGD